MLNIHNLKPITIMNSNLFINYSYMHNSHCWKLIIVVGISHITIINLVIINTFIINCFINLLNMLGNLSQTLTVNFNWT